MYFLLLLLSPKTLSGKKLNQKDGKIMMDGCDIMKDNPKYFCKECEYKWNREQAIDAAYSKIKAIKASVGGYFSGY